MASLVGWPRGHRVRWSSALVGCPAVAVLAMLGTATRAAPPLVQPAEPQPIIGGNPVPECAWPSVVALYAIEGDEHCTGFYIGGRVVLTAAHCILPWFRVPPADGKASCESDADCPQVDAFGDPITVVCPPGGADLCEDPDPTKSNDVVTALFGEAYPDRGVDGHIRRAVDVVYCRRRNELSDAQLDFNRGEDFAYCILREEPNVQPIPIAMHCEVEQFLAQGTPVTAVGFGRSDHDDDLDVPGIKRSATSVLPQALGGSETTFNIGQGWSPGAPTTGDSGGPLLVALPDGTWRVIGVAVTSFAEYVPPWRHVGWILSDPNVVQTEILPCHTPQGDWAPSAGCGGFPMSPGTPAGSWGRGPIACFDPEVGGPSQTCGPPGEGGSGAADETGAPTMGVGGGDDGGLGELGKKDDRPASGSGCACRVRPSSSEGLPLGILVAFAFLGARRGPRRRRPSMACSLALAVIAALLLTACPDNQVGAGPGAGTTDGVDTGPPPGPPPIDPNNPEYQGILGGIDPDPSVDYHDLAVGNASRAASSSECCQDYVIASPSTSVVRVLFSEDLPGLTFLADLPDELVDVGGPGVDDVLLADGNGDDRNDLVALRTDGNVAVVRGIGGFPSGPFFDPATLAVVPAGAAEGSMAVGDLDCDGDLDIAVTAPTTDGVVVLAGSGNGTFVASTPTPAGNAPQDIALGDVDGDDELDIAVSNIDGSFSVVINNCGSFAPADSYEIHPTTTPAMPIAMSKLCPGHPDALAVATGVFDLVHLTCGDGTGDFGSVAEPHGQQVAAPYDYIWDFQPGYPTDDLITDLFAWERGSALYALRLQDSNTSEVTWLPPAPANLVSGAGRTIVTLYGGESFTEATIHALRHGGNSWTRIGFVGSPGIGVSK